MSDRMLVDGKPIDYSTWPGSDLTRKAIERYIEHRQRPGSFMGDVLSNNLGAVLIADEENLAALPEVVRWLYSHAPRNCFGSVDAMDNWLAGKAA